MTAAYRAAYASRATSSVNMAPVTSTTGDLLILCAHSNATVPSISSTGGQTWTLIATHPNNRDRVWTAIYNGTGGGPILSVSGSGCAVLAAYQVGTFDTTTPIDTNITTASPANSTSMSIGTIVTTVDDALLAVWAGGSNDNNAGASPYTSVATGWTTIAFPGTSAGTDCGGIYAQLVKAVAGTSPAASVIQSASYAAAQPILFAIRPRPKKAAAVNATLGGLTGTVTAAISSGSTINAAVTGTLAGLTGTVTATARRTRQLKPRRERVWVSGLTGEQIGVIT